MAALEALAVVGLQRRVSALSFTSIHASQKTENPGAARIPLQIGSLDPQCCANGRSVSAERRACERFSVEFADLTLHIALLEPIR
jgi:hypothetical protein